MFRFTAASILTLSLLCAAKAQSIVERSENDEISHMASEEPAMRAAFSKAKATLSEFLLKASAPAKGTTGYALKVAIADERNTEYFWVSNFSNNGDRFTGTLNNEPRLVKKHRLGEKISFHRDQIADWIYIDQKERRMVGNFTACALLTKEPPSQAAEFKRMYGLQCEP